MPDLLPESVRIADDTGIEFQFDVDVGSQLAIVGQADLF